MEQPSPAATPFRDVYTVSRLNREAKALLEGGFPPIWIEGEISNLSRPASGHVYFSLKDAQAQVRCAFFRQHRRLLGIALKDGLHVLARARVSLYEGRGDYQIIIEYLEEAGEGALRRAFDALKQRLSQEGLFDVAHKKPLPRLPHRLGIITSPSGAVLHDILTTLRRRFPGIAVLVYPVPVQGEGAAEKIAGAIRLAGERGDCDALILARGGGSLEDLRAFNEEIVARAIHACPIPIVSGIGHETDFTIADMTADARAPTPTAAAEMLSPDQQEWLAQFARIEARLIAAMQGRLRNHQQHLDWLGARLVHPRNRIALLQQSLKTLAQRLYLTQVMRLRQSRAELQAMIAQLHQHSPQPRLQALMLSNGHLYSRLVIAMRRRLELAESRLRQLMQSLHTLSPLATLERGYAVVQHPDTGAIVTDAGRIRPGERVRARLARGQLDCLVEKSDVD
ncbi:MAG: exodeoxyribonuclease VII large subunit [Candidatus Muproteobacteria bacterium RIFCSPHIGHO2_12_FULL_60_33]|nr:MAG: exodeoxyribonuclease VII large subunit [Candidatus Muproteobacteria bacterium RIFCSPHIGHO2_02_FULL_60_13]OGI55615.1 MAG: exodeoxyribonuclease VII large subunit [Candidatus Muproteobacteria bacterium RIFCSPHIGHO2_12_FULL_60_33]OGI59801.1 MAG: exodeoxyribonuclease VII large subunit [Candidatus Muproteobacteria bacterium RIFCSPHIGHO2_01_FULL_61_200]